MNRTIRLTITVCGLIFLLFLNGPISCTPKQHVRRRGEQTALIDYVNRAKEQGSREALVPYNIDEEEGEMLIIRSLEEAMASYEWVVGEPIEEKTLTWARVGAEPDSIYTGYRFRISKRLGRSKDARPTNTFEEKALQQLPLREQEVLVLKSGGNIVMQGVLLKKRGSPCFSELLPRPYLLALRTDKSDRVGWLEMGCRSIFSVNGERLIPREQKVEPLTLGMKSRFKNSLVAFSNAFAKPEFHR